MTILRADFLRKLLMLSFNPMYSLMLELFIVKSKNLRKIKHCFTGSYCGCSPILRTNILKLYHTKVKKILIFPCIMHNI